MNPEGKKDFARKQDRERERERERRESGRHSGLQGETFFKQYSTAVPKLHDALFVKICSQQFKVFESLSRDST